MGHPATRVMNAMLGMLRLDIAVLERAGTEVKSVLVVRT
jgi:hypothetical protein